MSNKNDFLKYQAQISKNPLLINVKKATGSYVYDDNNKRYIDLVAGVSSCTLGHSHPSINKAVKEQLDLHTHVMVYGEFIQHKPLELAILLAKYLPLKLNCTYLVNSGTEAIEGAIKLAKRKNRRKTVISCFNSYHGSTQGSLSAMGANYMKKKYEPLIMQKKVKSISIIELKILFVISLAIICFQSSFLLFDI